MLNVAPPPNGTPAMLTADAIRALSGEDGVPLPPRARERARLLVAICAGSTAAASYQRAEDRMMFARWLVQSGRVSDDR